MLPAAMLCGPDDAAPAGGDGVLVFLTAPTVCSGPAEFEGVLPLSACVALDAGCSLCGFAAFAGFAASFDLIALSAL